MASGHGEEGSCPFREWNGVPLHVPAKERASAATTTRQTLPPPLTRWRDVLAVCSAPLGRTHFPGAARRVRALRRAFYDLRCGVFVRVVGRRVHAFVPFCNTAFRNRWHGRRRYKLNTLLEPRGAPETTTGPDVAARLSGADEWASTCAGRGEPVLLDEASWWCNGAILCNYAPSPESSGAETPAAAVWGDTYLYHILWMLTRAAARREAGAPPIEFLVNKRDHPQVRRDGRDPYGFMYAFDGGGAAAASSSSTSSPPSSFSWPATRWPSTLPCLSFYGGDDFADLLMPTTDDVEAAWPDRAFPPHFRDASGFASTRGGDSKDDDVASREPRAFFRGSATGRGVWPSTNQRMALARWAQAHPDLADAGLTGWNARDKVQPDGTVVRVQPASSALRGLRRPFVPMVEQRRFMMHVYADGHCAASRLGSMLALGGVVLRVASLDGVPGKLWLDDIFEASGVEGGARVPDVSSSTRACWLWVDADLGNLEETIRFVRHTPRVARAVAANARRVARAFVSPAGIDARVGALLEAVEASQAPVRGGSS